MKPQSHAEQQSGERILTVVVVVVVVVAVAVAVAAAAVVVVVSDTCESVCMCTTPQTCKATS